VTSSQTLIDQVNEELKIQIDQLSRKTFMLQSLKNNGLSILVDDEDEAAEVINLIAPEHCEILINNPNEFVKKITNAGAIFIGPYSPEPLGDYLAGPNHTLPTSRTARFSSALGVDDFIKKISIINYSKEDLLKNANVIMTLAEYEGLDAHKRAIEVRTNED
jgi:histidinol dehydrogenase